MHAALREAQKAFDKNEVPIGAVAVQDGKIIARAHNLREAQHDPLGHAEILLLKKLSKKLKRWRLNDITLYVTLEPCLMCIGALRQARVKHLFFGASQDSRVHSSIDSIQVTSNILQKECSFILSLFFRELRKNKVS